MQPGRSSVANGNIPPSRAIKIDTTVNDRVLVAADGTASRGDKCIGISQKGQRKDPTQADGYAAIAGEAIGYYEDGTENIPAEIGSGGCTAGDYLKANASGKLIAATADGDNVVAQARATAVDGEIINVDVRIFVLRVP